MNRVFQSLTVMVIALLSLNSNAATPQVTPLSINPTTKKIIAPSGVLNANSNEIKTAVQYWIGPGAPSYMDIDAEQYIHSTCTGDPIQVARVNRFVIGMKALGLWNKALLITSLRSGHNKGTGSTVYSLVGPNGTITGSPTWDNNGLTFNGAADKWVSFNNPGAATLSAFTMVAAFDSDQTTSKAVFGSLGGSGARGPMILAGGSSMQGTDAEEIFFDHTTDGIVSAISGGSASRKTKYIGNTGAPQFFACGYSATESFVQDGYMPRQANSGTYAAAWNGNAQWRIGILTENSFPFVGHVAFVALFNSYLSQIELTAFRRLWEATIGDGYIQDTQAKVIYEGDSLTAGVSTYTPWPTLFQRKTGWVGKHIKRNYSVGGRLASVAANESDTNFRAQAREPISSKRYAFVWIGSNDVAAGDSAATIYANLQKIWAAARAAGFKVIACTIIPSTGHGAFASNRTSLNTLIRNGSANYDYLVDLANVVNLQTFSNTTYFDADQIHLKTAGNQEVADAVAAVLSAP